MRLKGIKKKKISCHGFHKYHRPFGGDSEFKKSFFVCVESISNLRKISQSPLS